MTHAGTKIPKALLMVVVVGLISCVTINIYFPAEEVKKAAEEIVGEIRPESGQPAGPAPGSGQQSALEPSRVFHWALTSALAQSPTTISNQAINNLKGRLRARQPQLAPFFDSGAIGEDNLGFIQILTVQNLSVKDRARLQRLVEADQSDRRQLYQQVARAVNVEAGQEARIGVIFAAEWQKASRKGWYIQQQNGNWVQK